MCMKKGIDGRMNEYGKGIEGGKNEYGKKN